MQHPFRPPALPTPASTPSAGAATVLARAAGARPVSKVLVGVGIGLGVGVGPVAGGACFALCAWQAARARRHPGVAPRPSANHDLVGPDGDQRVRIAWLGDSLAFGVGVDHPDDTPSGLVAAMLERPVEVRMLAVPGARSEHVVADQLPLLEREEVDLVVVCVGSNDVASPTSRRSFASNLHAVLEATAPTPTVVLTLPDIGMADRIGQPLRWLAARRAAYFEAARTRVARRHDHATSVDIKARPGHVSRAEGRELLSPDRFHPGPEVYREWASRIATAAEHLLDGAGHLVDEAVAALPGSAHGHGDDDRLALDGAG